LLLQVDLITESLQAMERLVSQVERLPATSWLLLEAVVETQTSAVAVALEVFCILQLNPFPLQITVSLLVAVVQVQFGLHRLQQMELIHL
jgi:hypothetical protein